MFNTKSLQVDIQLTKGENNELIHKNMGKIKSRPVYTFITDIVEKSMAKTKINRIEIKPYLKRRKN